MRLLRSPRALSVLLLIVAGFTAVVADSTEAAAAPARAATPRLDGRFTLHVRVVKAINVSGRHKGQRFSRSLTFGRACGRRHCGPAYSLGRHAKARLTRVRGRNAAYVGRRRFRRPCRSRDASGKRRTTRTLRVRVTSSVRRNGRRFASRVRGTMQTRASGCGRRSAERWVFVGRRDDDAPAPRPPAPAPPGISPESPGPVLWEDSFERADIREGWAAVQEVQSDHTARTSPAHARDGAHSARFEVRDGDNAESSTDERQQLSDALMPDGGSFRPKDGDDLYIAISLWFEPGFPFAEGDAAWQVYLPFVSFDARGSGPAKLGSGGPLRFEGVEDVPWLDSEPAATGGWHDFVLRLKFSQDPQVGLLQIWHRTPSQGNYVNETFDNGQQARRFATLLEPSAYLKLGIYRDGRFTRTGVLHVDRIKVADRFASVAIPPGA